MNAYYQQQEVFRLYLCHQRCGLRHRTTRAPGFLSLVQFLLDNGANPNAICSHSTSYYGASQGTALDLFAGQLMSRSGNIVFDEDIASSLVDKLANEGAEFSRPLKTSAGHVSHCLSQRFEIEIGELKQFPEQIEGQKLLATY